MQRKVKNAPGEYYHIYNRGMQKQPIFVTDGDRLRFLFLILSFQSKKTIPNVSRTMKQLVQSRALNIPKEFMENIIKNRSVELVSFCLMPNHFHLQLKELEEGGITNYMHRVLTAYTNYFNIKYKKSGHLFQGPYKSVWTVDDLQLIHTSAYIHKNPSELVGWKENYEQYPWSSLLDYLQGNRFGGLLVRDVILDRYKKDEAMSYKEYVETSTAKEEEPL